MSRKQLTATLVLFAMVLTAATASAMTPRWGGQVWGGFNTHSMGDWNNAIDQANLSGGNFDNINNGFSFGVGPTMWVNENWQFGAHYERLMAHTSSDQGTEVKPSANAIGVTGTYWFPSTSKMNFGVGASLDYMTLAGELDSPTSTPTTAKIEGSGMGGAMMVNSNYAMTPTVSWNMSAGYRFANINIDTIGGQSTTGSSLNSEDYSGLSLRVGFSLTQPASSMHSTTTPHTTHHRTTHTNTY